MKKLLATIMMLTIAVTVLAAPSRFDTSLNSNNISYLQCGFAKGNPPPDPTIKESIQTRGVGQGGFTPAQQGDLIIGQSPDGSLDIHSDVYSIWVFKLGIKKATVTLEGFPLKHESNNQAPSIAYDIHFDKNNPQGAPKAFTVEASTPSTTYTFSDSELGNKFINYWTMKFVIKVTQLPSNMIEGIYRGYLTLRVATN